MKKSNKATKLFSVLIAVVMLLGVISVGMMASAADRGVWDANTQYNGGDRVTYNGIVYEAKYWINSNEASPDKNTGWKKVLAEGEIPTWDAGAIYASGDQVIYQGNVYKASWDTARKFPVLTNMVLGN